MKYLIKILKLQIIVIVIGIFQSCCDDKPYLHFDVLNLGTPRYFTQSNLKPDSTIYPDKFYITPFFNHNAYSENIFRVVNTAYAVSPCVTGEKGSKESIINFSILSNSDVDSVFTAGVELSSLFKYNAKDKFPSAWDTPDSLVSIDDNFYESLRLNHQPRLWFVKKFVKTAKHTFTVRIKLSDNREFVATTGEIIFIQ